MRHPVEYEVIYSNRKTVAIQVTREGKVRVRAPRRCSRSFIDTFVTGHEDWIQKHLEQAQEQKKRSEEARAGRPPLSEAARNRYIRTARDIFSRKAAYYARLMGVTYGRITIREQKTRWGSCSSKGNLNFNWRLIFAPEEVLDYVVVHELAHRKEMNHSPAFYTVVESVLPDYRKARKWLKDNGQTLWDAV